MMNHDNATNGRKELPTGWRWARLGEVCDINPSRPREFKRDPDTLTTFIPMAAVDGDLGQIVASEERLYSEVARGYTYFAEGDVLFAKITPCMQNKKSAIAKGLIDEVGFGSTEFHILRPQNEILAEWIYFQLRDPTFLALAEANFTGAVGQQRVPASFLEQYPIPFPPLATQRAIARQLDRDMAEVARLRAAAERQRAAVAALPSAYLREVFESAEARGWERVPIAEVCNIAEGQVDPRLPEFHDLPHINGEVIESGTGRLLPYRTVADDRLISGKYLFQPGSVIFSKLRPYLRKVAYVDFQGLCSADAYPLIAKARFLRPFWLKWVLLSDGFSNYAIEESLRSRMPKLNREQLLGWKMPLPDLASQERIAQILESSIEQIDTIAKARRAPAPGDRRAAGGAAARGVRRVRAGRPVVGA
jgi:type I restriction enzyme S subunit